MGAAGGGGAGAAGLAPIEGNLPGLGAPGFCAKGSGEGVGPGVGGFCGVTAFGAGGLAAGGGDVGKGATGGRGAGVGTIGGGGATGATGAGARGGAAGARGAAGVAVGVATAASLFILNFGPKMLVTSSGTSTFFWGRRESIAGFIAARMAGKGNSIMTSS